MLNWTIEILRPFKSNCPPTRNGRRHGKCQHVRCRFGRSVWAIPTATPGSATSKCSVESIVLLEFNCASPHFNMLLSRDIICRGIFSLGLTIDTYSRSETRLILKRASASRPSGHWNDDDFTCSPTAPLSAASSRPMRRPQTRRGVDPRVRAPRGPHADTGLRGDAQGGNGRVRQVMAVREPPAAS
jgi:hypothetical protein